MKDDYHADWNDAENGNDDDSSNGSSPNFASNIK